jgi:hypothetical protein
MDQNFMTGEINKRGKNAVGLSPEHERRDSTISHGGQGKLTFSGHMKKAFLYAGV